MDFKVWWAGGLSPSSDFLSLFLHFPLRTVTQVTRDKLPGEQTEYLVTALEDAGSFLSLSRVCSTVAHHCSALAGSPECLSPSCLSRAQACPEKHWFPAAQESIKAVPSWC